VGLLPETGLLSLITVMISGDALETVHRRPRGRVGFHRGAGQWVMFTSRPSYRSPARRCGWDARR